MSSWEDTVMKESEVLKLVPPASISTVGIVRPFHRTIARKQAEISFEAGIEKGRQKERERINQWSFSKEAEKEVHNAVDVPVGQGDKHHMDEHSVSYITLSVLGCIREALKEVEGG